VVAYLIVPEAELAAEPPDVRKWVAAYHAAEDTSARDAVLAQLDEIAWARVAGEITALHERAEQMRAGAAEEVDKRINDLLDRGPRGPRGPRGGRPH
jgi:phage-related minor tail protein